jgi:hypothetical protein
MEQTGTILLLITGALITVICLFVNIYLGGIALVILITLGMSLWIMQDSAFLPYVVAHLRDDAKAVVITNTGNARAVRIHVALVPVNKEFDLPSLDADASSVYPLDAMAGKVKAILSYENEEGKAFSRTVMLSALESEFDPFKPVFPFFRWK